MVTDAHQIFNDFIKGAGLRGTEQRALILDTFLNTDEHVSVDDLFGMVKLENKKIGYATVHRTMKLITESGLAREVVFNDGIARFEHTLDTGHHHHFVCKSCDAVIEFNSDAVDAEEKRLAKAYGFEVQSHHFKIYGICKECRRKKRT
ncbi:MAG: transcriptional repressor [Candidatus Zixiibacteriota bacterium]